MNLEQRKFVPGQRWLSEAEPDLGLGVIESVDARQLRVVFAASGETRNYALHNAPLGRVQFVPDDRVQDQQGNPLTVQSVDDQGGVLCYACVDAAGRPCLLPESSLNDRMRLNRPQDKLLARRIDADSWFRLRYRSWRQSAALWRSPVFGLQGARVDLIPHQMYIAAEVAGRQAPRVLLADEVGLGKTIEAGLILHRLVLTERIQRVLVVLPDALVNQWLVEMLRRFNLRFAVFDDERFEQAGAENPFHSEQRVLCSLSFLTDSPEVARAALGGEWDLLIVDEAHHLAWSETDSSLGYQLVEAIAGTTPSVMLLTATPEQLGRAGHFGRLRLLDPQRFHDYAGFLAEEDAYQPVAELAARLLDGEALDAAAADRLQQLCGEDPQATPAQLVARLIDRHGTGRVLFRNTRHAIKGFPQRLLHTCPLALPEQYAGCRELPQPETAVEGPWTTFDPRVDWLVGTLQRLAPQKVLVICAQAATVIALRDHLLARHAIHAAVFHQHMEIVARDRAAAFFADSDAGAQVLICSEIGSEGRNFQFAHQLVLFDLPLDPDLLEQRIGRLDRIGQRETIELHVPYLADSAGEVLMRWYRDALGSFEASCPAAAAVYDRLGERLREVMHRGEGLDQLIDEAAALTAQLNAGLEAGRDRLLELHSCDPDRAAQLVTQVAQPIGDVSLEGFMRDYWDAFGVEHEAGVGHSTVLQPGTHMRHEHFPGLGSEPITVTFDRADALAHEDRQFLSWEHPMVRGSMEMLSSDELGTAAVIVCTDPAYRTGTAFLETLFVLECTAPPGLELQRYLPPTCLRFVLDAQGEDHAAELPHAALQGLCLAQNRKLADTVIKSQSARLKPLLSRAEGMAEAAGAKLAKSALRRMRGELRSEQQRLVALAAVNPNVREDEIAQLQAKRDLLGRHLGEARVRLDALRIVVMR